MCRSYKYLFYFYVLFLIGCIHLERNPASGYGNSEQKIPSPDGSPLFNFNNDISRANLSEPSSISNLNYKLMADLGITPEALSRPELHKKYELQLTIKNFEKYITSDREKKQYFSSIPWFKSDEERMEFLKQPGYEARLLWMRNKGFGKRSTQLDDETAEIIEKKDIALGMSQEHVKKSWGTPDSVEIAGNPLYRNERWKYKRYISSTEGYKLQKRIIYFEGGKLVGWEQADD
jgi:hypothetical protein